MLRGRLRRRLGERERLLHPGGGAHVRAAT
ncbi:XRE family transcriptional regulator, partial [Streptomyces albidoflavus]